MRASKRLVGMLAGLALALVPSLQAQAATKVAFYPKDMYDVWPLYTTYFSDTNPFTLATYPAVLAFSVRGVTYGGRDVFVFRPFKLVQNGTKGGDAPSFTLEMQAAPTAAYLGLSPAQRLAASAYAITLLSHAIATSYYQYASYLHFHRVQQVEMTTWQVVLDFEETSEHYVNFQVEDYQWNISPQWNGTRSWQSATLENGHVVANQNQAAADLATDMYFSKKVYR